MTARVVVVGAGNIGSRHLQALARVSDAEIYAVDRSRASLDIALERYVEVAGTSGNPLERLAAIYELPDAIDVAVVATTADVRAAAVIELVQQKDVRFLVLEKVLFQRVSEYEAVSRLLSDRNTRAWANLPRRQYDGYRSMVRSLRGAKWLDYRVTGSSWGLACNGLHFLDQLCQIVGNQTMTIETSRLDPGSHASRRPGFRELTGELSGRCGSAEFSLTSLSAGDLPLQVSIESPSARYVLHETPTKLQIGAACSATGWRFELTTTRRPQQSELTDLVVHDLLERGTCELTPFEEAMPVHVSFIGAVLGHLRSSEGFAGDACPIT